MTEEKYEETETDAFPIYDSMLWFTTSEEVEDLKKELRHFINTREANLSDNEYVELAQSMITMTKHIRNFRGVEDLEPIDGLTDVLRELSDLMTEASKYNREFYKHLVNGSLLLREHISIFENKPEKLAKELAQETNDTTADSLLLQAVGKLNRQIENDENYSKLSVSNEELKEIEKLTKQEKLSKAISMMFAEKSISRQKKLSELSKYLIE